MATVDHRRATADRNRTAILDAAERLLAQPVALSMAAVAAEAGVSRPTLYAHFKTLGDVVEGAAARAVAASSAAFDEAEPERGPAAAALERVLATSWRYLASLDTLVRGAAEHLSAERMHRAHAPLMVRVQGLVERGQEEGAFRSDLPAAWLVTACFALIHAADEHTRRSGMDREAALEMVTTSIRDLFTGGAR